MEELNLTSKPFKVVDAAREVKLGLTASSIWELEHRARIRLDIDVCTNVRIVLECDGTEIDDNDYFVTLEPDTSLMILQHDQCWTPYKSNFSLGLALEPPGEDAEECDFDCHRHSSPGSPVEDLVWRLRQDLSFFPWLSEKEVLTIAKMDKQDLSQMLNGDTAFLEFLQELCNRYLQEKENSGKDSGGSGGEDCASGSSGTGSQNGSILNDPIRLIKLYSRSKHYLNTRGNFERMPQQ